MYITLHVHGLGQVKGLTWVTGA